MKEKKRKGEEIENRKERSISESKRKSRKKSSYHENSTGFIEVFDAEQKR